MPEGRAAAQPAVDAPESARENRVEDIPDFGQMGSEASAPETVDKIELSKETLAALDAAFAAYYAYRETGYEHRRAVFKWQLFSSKVIFLVVISLVVVGVYFSWLQFKWAFRRVPGSETPSSDELGRLIGTTVREMTPPSDKLSGMASTIVVSPKGFEVSSPVLGVIILLISLAFFYLYLVHVYPINEIL
jgi:hypothetical protein